MQETGTKNKEVFDTLDKYNMDITALTGKTKERENVLKGSCLHVYNRVDKKRTRAGVSLVIHMICKHCIKKRKDTNDRLLQIEIEIWDHTC